MLYHILLDSELILSTATSSPLALVFLISSLSSFNLLTFSFGNSTGCNSSSLSPSSSHLIRSLIYSYILCHIFIPG
ncbi:hypothetical protein B0T17DRAFT_535253 [Bombardia bombarda]|uniref:Uncharacterized protein n=1 Tax=Bombardia bombarda TaxID=252184 RepID=A0AA39WUH7_9PEZI|nr:hypothetical protein B0T17DRAFT_535253 [Bombardia bombarda]